MERRPFTVVTDAGSNPKRSALQDYCSVRPRACLEYGFGLERRGVDPGETRSSSVRYEHLAIIGNGASYSRKPRQRCNMFLPAMIDNLHTVARRMRYEDQLGFGIEHSVVKRAVRRVRYVNDADTLQRHDGLMQPIGKTDKIIFEGETNIRSRATSSKPRALRSSWTDVV